MKKINIFIKQNWFLILAIILCIASLFINFDKVNYYTYVSYSDGQNKAIVEKVKLSEKDIIKKYKNHKYVKIDNIDSYSKINNQDLKLYISNTKNNSFMFGINYPDYDIVILSEEVNANELIDYEKKTLDIDKINNYLKEKGLKIEISENTPFKLITTSSKYLKNNNFINLTPVNGFHRQNYNHNDIQTIINNASKRLTSMINNDGSYIYGYKANEVEKYTSYNILRHAGSTWSLIKYYQINPDKQLKEKIDLSIKYLIDKFLVVYNENTNYIIERKNNEIKLGGNALTLLMLSEYQTTFNDNKFEELANKIANGILKMQNDDGSYNHILNDNFELKEKYRTVFYDGEATLALLKFYEITKDEQYLKAAQNSLNYFIDNNYEQYRDHWIEYSIKTYLKYNKESKYINFALSNYIKNKGTIYNINVFSPTRLELVIQALYSYDEYKYDDKDLYNELITATNNNVKSILSYYIDECIAMYYNNPDKVVYGFHDPTDDFRMRIDDIQHSILGLMEYEKIKA